MLNKFFKIVNNKYSNIFKFFFSIKYIFLIFLVATSLFFIIPKFFDYEKKEKTIKAFLSRNYSLDINRYSSIKYNIFPRPSLEISNTQFTINDSFRNLNSEKVYIFLKFNNIYNFDNFEANSVSLLTSQGEIEISKLYKFFNEFNKIKKKIKIENFNLIINKKTEKLLNVKNINWSNYGYNKNNVTGLIFDKKFHMNLKNNILNFDIKNTGIKAKIDFNENTINNIVSGSSKINLLKNLLKFDFEYKDNILKISKSNFRNKKLSISLDGLIKFTPFFNFYTSMKIDEIDQKLIEAINLKDVISERDFIQKLNGSADIFYENTSYFKNLIINYKSNFNLAFGRLSYSDEILVAGGKTNCELESLITDEFPRIYFICIFDISNKKKFYKNFSISKKNISEQDVFEIEGSINILNNKVNFKKITSKKNFTANEQDLKFFKEKFENLLLDEGFFKILNKDKIGNFILEII